MDGNPLAEVEAVTSDSRTVTKNTLFVAVTGAKADGNRYVEMATQKGASVIVSEAEKPSALASDVTWIRVASTRHAVSEIAAIWYPTQPAYTVAVTGTDGKTSTADFFRQISELTGKKAASIGTLGVLGSAREYPALNTTPDPILLHRTLSEIAQEGITHVGLEASSHGLDQHRLHGVNVCAAAFTNLSRDHLDYHLTMENYFAAKLKLFTEVLKKDGVAVINADSPYFAAIQSACEARGHRVVSYGKAARDYVIHSITPTTHGLNIHTVIHGQPCDFLMPLIGSFQVYNFMAALGMAEICGIDPHLALQKIAAIKGVPGRLEYVASHPQHAAPVYVDYAHTPAALENILKIMRPHIEGKLHVVFGCGGDRDAGKRPEMGISAATYADAVVVTDDNPRSESPDLIRAAILKPLTPAQQQKTRSIGDRKEAIAFAIGSLQKGDGLVIAGKGHEKTQIIGNTVIPFDDAAVAREIMAGIQ